MPSHGLRAICPLREVHVATPGEDHRNGSHATLRPRPVARRSVGGGRGSARRVALARATSPATAARPGGVDRPCARQVSGRRFGRRFAVFRRGRPRGRAYCNKACATGVMEAWARLGAMLWGSRARRQTATCRPNAEPRRSRSRPCSRSVSGWTRETGGAVDRWAKNAEIASCAG